MTLPNQNPQFTQSFPGGKDFHKRPNLNPFLKQISHPASWLMWGLNWSGLARPVFSAADSNTAAGTRKTRMTHKARCLSLKNQRKVRQGCVCVRVCVALGRNQLVAMPRPQETKAVS